MRAYRALYAAIQSFGKPLVAALNGLALGSAFQSVLLMDYRVGHRDVRFGLPEISSGLPCITGSTVLTWAIGATRARNIAITGRFVDADEALQLGLIDEIVDEKVVLDRAIVVAASLAEKSPEAYAATKRWFRDTLAKDLDAAFEHAGAVRSSESMSRSIEAGVSDFLSSARRSVTRST
jgi:enoyl-CoA hydratase/carnithine racemase